MNGDRPFKKYCRPRKRVAMTSQQNADTDGIQDGNSHESPSSSARSTVQDTGRVRRPPPRWIRRLLGRHTHSLVLLGLIIAAVAITVALVILLQSSRSPPSPIFQVSPVWSLLVGASGILLTALAYWASELQTGEVINTTNDAKKDIIAAGAGTVRKAKEDIIAAGKGTVRKVKGQIIGAGTNAVSKAQRNIIAAGERAVDEAKSEVTKDIERALENTTRALLNAHLRLQIRAAASAMYSAIALLEENAKTLKDAMSLVSDEANTGKDTVSNIVGRLQECAKRLR